MPTLLDFGTPNLHFGTQKHPKSCLGGVLGVILAFLAALEGLLERLRLVLGRLEGILDRLGGILGRLGGVLERLRASWRFRGVARWWARRGLLLGSFRISLPLL